MAKKRPVTDRRLGRCVDAAVATIATASESTVDSSESTVAACRTFDELYSAGFIGQRTLRFVKSLGFERSSPIQDAVIPIFSSRNQVFIQAAAKCDARPRPSRVAGNVPIE